jgi:hypothetical protein
MKGPFGRRTLGLQDNINIELKDRGCGLNCEWIRIEYNGRVKSTILWDVLPCSLLKVNQCLGGHITSIFMVE